MNSQMLRARIFTGCLLLCLGISFLSLTACIDLGFDGLPDPDANDGLMLGPAIPFLFVPAVLLARRIRARFAPPAPFPSLIARPPI